MSKNDYNRKKKRLVELKELYGKKPYSERYKAFFLLSLILGIAFQVGSALSSSHYFETQVGLYFKNASLVFMVAALFVVAIEVVKHYAWNRYFADQLGENPVNKPVLVLALAVSAASLCFSVVGGGEYVNFNPDISNVNQAFGRRADKLSANFQAAQTMVKDEIAEIKERSTWQGRTYILKRDSPILVEKEKQLQQLRENHQRDLAQLRQEKESATAQLTAQESTGKAVYMYGFALFDLLFLLCTVYKHHYQYKEAEELSAELEPEHNPLSGHNGHPAHNGKQVMLGKA